MQDVRLKVRVESPDRRPITLERVARVRTFAQRTTRVEAGKCAMLQLNEQPVLDPDDVAFYCVESDSEGVEYWPIDSATPEVDPDTRAPGYLLDLDADVFSHDHADWSVNAVDHDLVGTRLFHAGEFPVFMENAYERANWPATKLTGTADLIHIHSLSTVANARVLSGGKALALGWSGTEDVGDGRGFQYFLGPDAPLNLGTEFDGLRIYLVGYGRDSDLAPDRDFTQVRLGCYPYCAILTDINQRPTTTADGETIWATNDRNLCFDHTGPVTDLYQDAAFTALGSDWAASLATFYQVLPLPEKGSWVKQNVQAASATGAPWSTVGSAPVWGRITKVHVRFAYDAPLGGPGSLVTNLWFGPPPGKRRWLRPFDLQSEKAWSAGSTPAIGIRNPLGHAINVRTKFGSL